MDAGLRLLEEIGKSTHHLYRRRSLLTLSIPASSRKKLSNLSSQALPALVRSLVISVPSRQPPRRKIIPRLRAVHVLLLRASRIVVRFFSDFDIFDPKIDKCSMCKK